MIMEMIFIWRDREVAERMKLVKAPVALVVLALAAEIAYIVVKGSKEVAPAKPGNRVDRKEYMK